MPHHAGMQVAEIGLTLHGVDEPVAKAPLRAGRVEVPVGAVDAVEPGRARAVSDPSPRQYCVKQGWLMRPGEIAICAPNRVSLQIAGRTKAYDSLSY